MLYFLLSRLLVQRPNLVFVVHKWAGLDRMRPIFGKESRIHPFKALFEHGEVFLGIEGKWEGHREDDSGNGGGIPRFWRLMKNGKKLGQRHPKTPGEMGRSIMTNRYDFAIFSPLIFVSH